MSSLIEGGVIDDNLGIEGNSHAHIVTGILHSVHIAVIGEVSPISWKRNKQYTQVMLLMDTPSP